MFDTTSLKEQYSLGDRKFSQADLERADLENIFLSTSKWHKFEQGKSRSSKL